MLIIFKPRNSLQLLQTKTKVQHIHELFEGYFYLFGLLKLNHTLFQIIQRSFHQTLIFLKREIRFTELEWLFSFFFSSLLFFYWYYCENPQPGDNEHLPSILWAHHYDDLTSDYTLNDLKKCNPIKRFGPG